MPIRPVLELRVGEPRWYSVAVAGVFLTIPAACLMAPLDPAWAVGLMVLAVCILWADRRQRRSRSQFRRLWVYPDQSAVLVTRDGEDLPLEIGTERWVTSRLIVVPVKLPCGKTERLPIASDRNESESFRRFAVLCRFGFAVDDGAGHNVARSHITGA